MALLPQAKIDEIWAEFMRKFSRTHTEIPINKKQLKEIVSLIDSGLETAETTIISGLTAGAGKTWLLTNQSVGRTLIEDVERKRKEVL